MTNKQQLTAMIKLKGWLVKDALEYWGRSKDWYFHNADGSDKQKIRLNCMINGLKEKTIDWSLPDVPTSAGPIGKEPE